jgi:SH3-like domain-containing protein
MRSFHSAILLCAFGLLASGPFGLGEARAETGADAVATGTVTGRPVPRFVSLRPNDTPMRNGPGKDHRMVWIYKRAGLPVEITAEFDTWRRVRDVEGAEGWIIHSRLSGDRTIMVRPQSRELAPVYRRPDGARVVARLEPGVIARVKACDGAWCAVEGEGFEGHMRQETLWGVYPGEIVED